MPGRHQQGEDLKDQGPRPGKQQIPIRPAHISAKLAVPLREERKRDQHDSFHVIKRKRLNKALPSLESPGDPPSRVHMCAPTHTCMYTCFRLSPEKMYQEASQTLARPR